MTIIKTLFNWSLWAVIVAFCICAFAVVLAIGVALFISILAVIFTVGLALLPFGLVWWLVTR